MNINQNYSDVQVYVAFRRAVHKFMECARSDLRRGKFKKMTQAERAAMGRALAKLDGVAVSPRKFFAPEYTEQDWRMRATRYAQEKKLSNVVDAYYIVQSPATLVWNMTRDLNIDAELNNAFFRLCDNFMQWEYRRVSDHLDFGFFANNYAVKVVEGLDFFERWLHKNRSVCEQWMLMKRTNPAIKNFFQKTK